MAVKPWTTVVEKTVPSSFEPSPKDSLAPDASLDLEYVYGYRCHDVRNNLYYLADGRIVFHTAAVGIVMDTKKNTQQFFFGHKDDILAIALHPDGKTVATGEIGPTPLICVWDTTTMQQITSFNSPLKKGVQHLAFSESGNQLAAVAMDDEHNVAVWDWNKSDKKSGVKGILKASGKGTRAKILSLAWVPGAAENMLVTTAVKEVKFFTVSAGTIKPKTGIGMDKIAE